MMVYLVHVYLVLYFFSTGTFGNECVSLRAKWMWKKFLVQDFGRGNIVRILDVS